MADRLDEILRTDPNVEAVRLDYQNIGDLTPHVSTLGVLPNMTSLDLSGNRLTSLPRLSDLRGVRVLNLENNPFRSASEVLPGLASLPRLAELTITLPSAEEEERVLMALPKLKVLNGTALPDGAPANAGSGTGAGVVDARAGAAAAPPPPPAPPGRPAANAGGGGSASASSSTRSRGGGGGGGGAVTGAWARATGGGDVSAESDDMPPPRATPAAPAPPATDASRAVDLGPIVPSREIVLTEDDLESVAMLFGAAKATYGKLGADKDLRLTARFDSHIKDTMRGVSSALQDLTDPFLRQGEILLAKQRLYDVCFQVASERAGAESKELEAVLNNLRTVSNELFAEFPSVLKDMQGHHAARIDEMRNNVALAERETAQLLEAAEELEAEAEKHSDEKQRLSLAFEKERQRLLHANAAMQRENAALQQRIRALESMPGVVGAGSGAGGNGAGAGASGGRGPGAAAGPGGGRTGPSSGGGGGDGGSAGAAGGTSQQQLTLRNLSLKQLKEVIEQIFASKLKFDQKCADAHLPRETMEQHMYTFLNQKYGLKSLIIEHASSIIRAVNKFSPVDNDVSVFGKILRNEIDEEFRYVQRQLKQTVAQLLRVYLKGKYPLKTDDAISAELDKRVQGNVMEAEWSEIVKYMYNREDSLALIVMVRELVAARRAEASHVAAEEADAAAARGSVPYHDFLRVLLDYQLRGHVKFLSKLREFYGECDTDENGVLDEDEFRDLVRKISPAKSDKDVEALVNLVDPFGNRHITFSESVSALSSDLVKLMSPGGAGSSGGDGVA